MEAKKQMISLYAGLVLLVVGIAWALYDARQRPSTPQPAEVKQTVIPLPSDAFDGDPRLQSAVQNLVQQDSSPQPTSSNDLNTLQPQQGGN